MVGKSFKNGIVAFIMLGLLFTYIPAYGQQANDTENKTNNTTTEAPNEEVVHSKVYQGEVQFDVFEETDYFTGEKKAVEKGTKIDLTVSTVISSEMSSQGDEFFAEVSNDVLIDGATVLPTGTVAHGTITETSEEKRLGRNGFVKINFDYLLTPDGREIPIKASLSTKSHPIKSFAKVALTDMGYTLAGGAIGGLIALKIGGLGMAVASHGYSVAGGAAVGGTIGLAQSLIRKGKPLLISPGDQIKIKMTSDINLPVIKQTALAEKELNLDGLAVEINDFAIEKDPFGSLNTINLGVDIVNQSDHTFTFFDVGLVSENGNVYYPSPFGDTEMWFQKISPGTKLNGYLSFSVDNTRDKHWLVFFDKYSRTQLAKVSVTNAMRKLKAEGKSKKRRNDS
ncbi:MAG: hypothetical protein AB7V50_05430 [Vampirovibrionia bacterium]